LTHVDADLARSVARLRTRRVTGAKTYRDTSRTRRAVEFVDDVEQELVDVCGWSLLLRARLERLVDRVEHAKGTGGNHG
jgi:hypothetical protein